MPIKGILVALTTPFTATGIDTAALQAHIQMLDPHATGLVIGGTTGESWGITDLEMQELLQAARAVAPTKTLVVGFWRSTIAEALATATAVQDYTDYLLIPIPGELFRASDEEILAFYTKIAKAVTKPILLYNYPSRCEHKAITGKLAAKIVQHNPNVVGVKDSSADSHLVQDIIVHDLPLQPILGNDSFLCEYLALILQYKRTFAPASISGACSVPMIAKIENQIYQMHNTTEIDAARGLLQSLSTQYFKPWAELSAQLGGQAPIIKGLVNENISDYPIKVRPPLKDLPH